MLLSCVSAAPLTAPPETPQERAASPAVLVPRWDPFVRGIDYFEGRTRSPRLELWALRVDLTDPGLEFVVNEPGPVPGIIPSVTPTGFVEEYRGVAGINANPFSPASATVGEDRTVVGITIADGVLIAPPHQSFDALVFYREGGAAMVNQGALGDTAPIRNAVGGFHMALKDGEIPARGSARHPRSAAGLSEDGKTLYLLVVDGNRLGSIGATEEELGLILKRLGASDGLNFDGGGSSALALRYPDGKVRAANTPIHQGIPGRERAVATCLGIRLRAGEE